MNVNTSKTGRERLRLTAREYIALRAAVRLCRDIGQCADSSTISEPAVEAEQALTAILTALTTEVEPPPPY